MPLQHCCWLGRLQVERQNTLRTRWQQVPRLNKIATKHTQHSRQHTYLNKLLQHNSSFQQFVIRHAKSKQWPTDWLTDSPAYLNRSDVSCPFKRLLASVILKLSPGLRTVCATNSSLTCHHNTHTQHNTGIQLMFRTLYLLSCHAAFPPNAYIPRSPSLSKEASASKGDIVCTNQPGRCN